MQNYDKGFDRFIRKFDPDVPMSAIMAIPKGVHDYFGTAILFTQENRRCLLLDTLHKRSEEDALWHTMSSWARFQPRTLRPKSDSGQLYYPSEYSHVFEHFWDVLEQPLAHPNSASESDFTKKCMQEYAAALLHDSSRAHFWAGVLSGEHRSSACTDGPSSLESSVAGTESCPALGVTDTCVPCGHPSQT
jgi:hypothetical protein